MKPLFVASCVAVMALPAFGQTKANTASAEKELAQIERDWEEAITKKDAAAADKFMTDDFVSINAQGKSLTKAELDADLKSGANAVQFAELGTIKVKVFGDVAVVTATDTEKSTYKGKDSSGKYIWTDVFVMRDGRWQAVTEQVTKLEK